ncbi:hypothetical protein ACOSP7_001462 [Xanthoceras sorbifolium]
MLLGGRNYFRMIFILLMSALCGIVQLLVAFDLGILLFQALLRFNADASVPFQVGHVELGVVIRDCFGHILLADTKLGGFGLSPQLAGAKAMCFDLLLAVGASFSPIYLELQWL